MFKKPQREVNEEFLDFIRCQPCCVCNMMPAEPHHLKSRGAGGSDMTCVPLSRRLHTEVHQIGKDTFQHKYGINFNHVNMMMVSKWHGCKDQS